MKREYKSLVLLVGALLLIAMIPFVARWSPYRLSADGFPPLQLTSRTPEHITLKTVGSPGQQFTGTLTVDGTGRAISGVTPAEFVFDCVVLAGEVTVTDGDGSFGFHIATPAGNSYVYAPTTNVARLFRYHDRKIEMRTKK